MTTNPWRREHLRLLARIGCGKWSLPVAGLKTEKEPYWYVPVFESYEAAVSWNNGSAFGIMPLRRWELAQKKETRR